MIALEWTAAGPDLARTPLGALAEDDGLRTAVLLSLFLDRRAGTQDPLPDAGTPDRRGWVGDALAAVPGDRIGSRLWLLRRAKASEATRLRAEAMAREALAWLVQDGVAERIAVQAELQGSPPDRIALAVTLHRGGAARRFALPWHFELSR